LIVHNETSTGVTTDVGAVRRGIDRSGHDPLLLVDVVSSLGSIDFRMDEWRVDVALTGTQKGLMLPPGGAILCVGPRALAAAETSRTPKYFYDWRPVIRDMQQGFFPYTPATLLLFGLRAALRMLFEDGLELVLALLYSGQRIELGVGVAAAQRFFAGVTADVERPTARESVASRESVG